MQDEQCTLHNGQCSMPNVQCTYKCTYYNAFMTVHRLQLTVHSLQFTVHKLKYTGEISQFTVQSPLHPTLPPPSQERSPVALQPQGSMSLAGREAGSPIFSSQSETDHFFFQFFPLFCVQKILKPLTCRIVAHVAFHLSPVTNANNHSHRPYPC